MRMHAFESELRLFYNRKLEDQEKEFKVENTKLKEALSEQKREIERNLQLNYDKLLQEIQKQQCSITNSMVYDQQKQKQEFGVLNKELQDQLIEERKLNCELTINLKTLQKKFELISSKYKNREEELQ